MTVAPIACSAAVVLAAEEAADTIELDPAQALALALALALSALSAGAALAAGGGSANGAGALSM